MKAAARGRGREATGTEARCMCWVGRAQSAAERVCVGHVWDTLDPDSRTLMCADREHRGKLRRILPLSNFPTACTSSLQATTTRE